MVKRVYAKFLKLLGILRSHQTAANFAVVRDATLKTPVDYPLTD